MHVCHSGCRVLLWMVSTSEPTFSSASASLPLSGTLCILISSSKSLLISVLNMHATTQGHVFRQGKAHHAGV